MVYIISNLRKSKLNKVKVCIQRQLVNICLSFFSWSCDQTALLKPLKGDRDYSDSEFKGAAMKVEKSRV